MIKKINLKLAGFISIAINFITIAVHLLVIFQVMPFKWINGGRSETFEIARQTSINGIIVLLAFSFIILLACGVIRCKLNKVLKIILIAWLWVYVALNCFGLVQQLLRTIFEKLVMSVLVFINVIVGIRLAIEKR